MDLKNRQRILTLVTTDGPARETPGLQFSSYRPCRGGLFSEPAACESPMLL